MHVASNKTRSAAPRRTFSPRSSDGCSSAARYCSGSPLAPSSLAAKLAAENVVAGEQPDRRQAWAKQVLPFLLAQAMSLVGCGFAEAGRSLRTVGAVQPNSLAASQHPSPCTYPNPAPRNRCTRGLWRSVTVPDEISDDIRQRMTERLP